MKHKSTFPSILIGFILLFASSVYAYQPRYSTAGFYQLENSGRNVASMNSGWCFFKGDVPNASEIKFDDSKWDAVSLPHSVEYLPMEASGGVNYQGVVWYRKYFTLDNSMQGKKVFIHFEAIMGKSKIYVNGKLQKEQFGGFLPAIIDVSEALEFGKPNVIAVWADNSNDPLYPPGKTQETLDFAYFGGIYRDCWLISHNDIFITDPNFENETAGGGLFVSYGNVSEALSEVNLKLHLRNQSQKAFKGRVEYELLQKDGKSAGKWKRNIQISQNNSLYVENKYSVKNPQLWSPESPYLYTLNVRIKNNRGETVDGYSRRIGIRSIEFKGKDGFWLNGKAYGKPVIGANRHQDFAVIGNALPNSLHWRDAKKLKDIGLTVIRNAHYPQDPAFMDACDELGLFVIVNTPGWQFWNNEPIFGQRVFQDIRNMVRRDRNHPSVWLWEPILNETYYPDTFAKEAKETVEKEYPYPYAYSACDSEARGKEHFNILFQHPADIKEWDAKTDPNITYFTREWGDNVDNWDSHNSPSRVARNWGEQPMLVQANHYAKPYYPYVSYDIFYRIPLHHVGGALWHSFDHQRGYHPDPFYGGLMDAFRQPKYSYYMFKAQRSPIADEGKLAETGPMVYIANQMTPFSSKDVTVFSNCDEVRLTFIKDGKTFHYKKDKNAVGMPSPIIVFSDVFDVMKDKEMNRVHRRPDDSYLLAEGIMDGKVVATHKVSPARRAEKIKLWIDNENVQLQADGSDIVTVIAAITDKNGEIKRLNNERIQFEVEGEGRIIGDDPKIANPVQVQWGTAPILIQSTNKSGKIKVKARVLFEGKHTPEEAEIEFESVAADFQMVK